MAISGASELLTDRFSEQMANEANELVKMIERGGNRLKVLVDRLLDISRIDYDRLQLEVKVENLVDLIKECADDLALNIIERKILLNIDVPDELMLKFDKTRIEQVITNLISNAIKNTPPNGQIFINLETEDNWAVFSIRDTGVGLTEEEQEILFTRFGNIQGSGLGLYIAKRILDLHGGKIFVSSEGRHKGSTFTVKLPI